MHDYIAQKLYEERATRLRADAATYRLARSAVRRPRDQPRRRPWWHRLSLGGRPATCVPREHADHVEPNLGQLVRAVDRVGSGLEVVGHGVGGGDGVLAGLDVDGGNTQTDEALNGPTRLTFVTLIR
jgi:hypothetical protein